jgi:ribosomal protein S15P/S13E
MVQTDVSNSTLFNKEDNNNNNNINLNNETNNNNINDTIESLFDVCFNTDEVEEKFIDERMDKTTKDKLKELIDEMNNKKENEEYDVCKIIKDKIDKIRKIALKIYTLEEEKKEYANKNDFDKAKELKISIEKIKKLLNFYLSDDYNKQNKIIKNKNINNRKIFVGQSQEELKTDEFLEYDEIILPVVLKKLKKK